MTILFRLLQVPNYDMHPQRFLLYRLNMNFRLLILLVQGYTLLLYFPVQVVHIRYIPMSTRFRHISTRLYEPLRQIPLVRQRLMKMYELQVQLYSSHR